jgi:hypothetical protein
MGRHQSVVAPARHSRAAGDSGMHGGGVPRLRTNNLEQIDKAFRRLDKK